MKNYLSSLFLLIALGTNAQIITVDNFNPGADFNNLQEAIDSSSNGDTIYVAGSNISYGNIIVNKSLTIFGNGYESTANNLKSQIGSLIFHNNCHLSHISGFEMDYASLNHTQDMDTDSIKLSDNKADYIEIKTGTYQIIEGNLLIRTAQWCVNLGYNTNSGCSNSIVRNNVLYAPILYSISNTNLIENNVFFRYKENFEGDPFYYNNFNANAIVTNNIFFGSSEATTQADCINCTFQFNRYYHYDGSAYVSDNPLFVEPDTLAFTNVHLFSTDHDINLQAGSPAIGAGQNGFDQGVTGGATPFEYGGFAPIPRVTSLTSPETTIQAGGTIQVTIEAVSQQ